MTAKKLNQRQAQWSFCLTRFDFILYYHPDKSMGKLDILSQQQDHRDSLHNNENIILLKPELLAVCASERMTFKGKEYVLLTDIQQENSLDHHKKSIARTI